MDTEVSAGKLFRRLSGTLSRLGAGGVRDAEPADVASRRVEVWRSPNGVEVELTPYDLTRGRITYRDK